MADGMPIDSDNNDNIPCLDEDSTAILAHITRQKILPAFHNIRNVLASAHKRSDANSLSQGQQRNERTQGKSSVIVDGKRYVQADKHEVTYKVANLEASDGRISSLIDRGANGGLAGEDVRLIETTGRTADVSGINNHRIRDLPANCHSCRGGAITPGTCLHYYAPIRLSRDGKNNTLLCSSREQWQ
jgi:hypothetical protein